MCGITGFVDFSNKLTEKSFNESLELLQHRGPDDKGTYFIKDANATIALGNRRLSIIDISDKGHQPFQSKCGNYILIFNGVIYNYKELREELIQLGSSFISSSDTEVLLQSYIQWPSSFLNKINGIFAFSIYDKEKNQVILARDNIGVKPFFYTYNGTFLLFSSELRTFLKEKTLQKKINRQALALYLQYAYFPNHLTILEDVYKVEPGTVIYLNLNNGQLKTEHYWKHNTNKPPIESHENISKELHLRLEKSITSRLISDVPFGVLLSGGFDSSLVAAIAQKHQKHPVKTFTIGFHEKDFNEAHHAEKIAKHIGSEHHSLYFDDSSIKDLISNVGKIFDEPMGDSGAIPLLLASKLSKNHVKVLLSAEGGDELFGGYTPYFRALKFSKFCGMVPIPEKLRNNRYWDILSQKDSLNVYKAFSRYFTKEQATQLTGVTIGLENLDSSADPLNNILNFDLLNYLPNDLLMKADRSMMHFGIENRDPFLDVDLVEYATSLKGNIKCPQGNAKFLLKQIAYQYIPQSLLDRPKKGFSMPVGKWLSENLKDFTEEKIIKLSERGLLDPSVILSSFKRFKQNPLSYYSKHIWVLLALELWLEEWMD